MKSCSVFTSKTLNKSVTSKRKRSASPKRNKPTSNSKKPISRPKAEYVDLRIYQHGLNFIRKQDGNYYAIFASSRLPPTKKWTHDIYYIDVNASNPNIGPNDGIKWIASQEAQEPASSAINASKTKIGCTWEDGDPKFKNGIGQSIYISDSILSKNNPYSSSKVLYDGGHSGHITAVGENFVVFWNDDWVDGGCADNLGSGDDNYVTPISSNGTIGNKVLVSSNRTWWPLLAGSSTHACLIWQKYVNKAPYANFMTRMYNPATGKMTAPIKLLDNVLFYHYNVAYNANLDRFLIIADKYGGPGVGNGSKCGEGYAWLLDNSGNIVIGPVILPDGIVRESNIIFNSNGTKAAVFRIKKDSSVFGKNSNNGNPGGLMVLNLTPNSIVLSEIVDDTYAWQYMGADGFFIDNSHVFTAALSNNGIRSKTYTLNEIPTPQYTITVTQSAGGTISPGTIHANMGDNVVFNITPFDGYMIDDVIVDSISMGKISTFTFTNIQYPRSISAVFTLTPVPSDLCNITVSQNSLGCICLENSTVSKNSNLNISFKPNSGCIIKDTIIDGISMGAQSLFSLPNIQSNHTISAIFESTKANKK